jgi:LmbE family N-acetylglucosaminyl deacetylase
VPDNVKGLTVLAIFAHPDDESLTCGGTLARLTDAGARVVLVCASRGEAGSISDPALVGDRGLGCVRVEELYAAAAVLGVHDIVVLTHPDGELRWAHVPEFHAEIVELVTLHQPSAVITFGEDGLYWHLDHVGVHERTFTAVRSFGDNAPPLYYVMMPKGIMREVASAVHEQGRAPRDSSFWGIEPDAFGDGATPPGFSIDVRPWTTRKLNALRCHRTQIGLQNPIAWIDEAQARQWLGVEYFRRAAIGGRDESPLEQLGEAVPSA